MNIFNAKKYWVRAIFTVNAPPGVSANPDPMVNEFSTFADPITSRLSISFMFCAVTSDCSTMKVLIGGKFIK